MKDVSLSPVSRGRRNFLKGSTAGLAALLASLPAPSVRADQGMHGRIIGLTTRDSSGDARPRSELLSLDLATGETTLTGLGRYRAGHSLLPLPEGRFLAVPYGGDRDPCLFLDAAFEITDRIYPEEGHGFGGHALLLPDNRTLFLHFNHGGGDAGRRIEDTGTVVLVDIETHDIVRRFPSPILHAHHIILSRDGKHVVVGDDGNIEAPLPENSPYSVLPARPALHLFDAHSAAFIRSLDLPINGGLVHLEQGPDGRVYGGVEQFVFRNEVGLEELGKLLGEHTDAFLAQFGPEDFVDEIPVPGPLVGVDLENGDVSSSMHLDHLDPFDIRLNQTSGLLFSVFITSNMLARRDPETGSWHYFSTADFGINEPYGLIEIPGTSLMALNGYSQGIAVFDARTMQLERYFDIPTYGMKHMLNIQHHW